VTGYVVYGLINYLFSSSDCIASSRKLNNELERIWREAVVQYKVVSEHLPAGTEANHKQPVRIADLWVEI
jgi:hypothetical protein